MRYNSEEIPEILILAQELQKNYEYKLSRKLYKDFFVNNPSHYLRFKALFEVADNWYYEKKYKEAIKEYNEFINYCNTYTNISIQELGWINAYKKLAYIRIKNINKQFKTY